MNFGKIVVQNRAFFKTQPDSITDKKNLKISADNVHLEEIIEYISWWANEEFRKLKNGK